MTFDGLDPAALAALIRAPRVELRERVTSTLDVAHELAAAGAPAGTLVLAEEQTAGRGRQGRRWQSPPGCGLWLTVVLRPRNPTPGGVIAIRAGLAAAAAVAEAAHEVAPRLKWPNDLIVAGRKAGGVLCEARWSGGSPGWVAVGVGINVLGPVSAEVREIAVSLQDVAPAVSRLAVLAALVPRLLPIGSMPTELTAPERAQFLDLCWTPPGEATPADLAPDGALLVRRADGVLDRRTDAT